MSKSDCFFPSNSTCGSFVHAMILSFGIPASSIALPKSSPSSVAPIQLSRSASASNGDADACTPLSPTFGSLLSPSDFQLLKISRRSEPSSAVAGSVAPSTLPRKSSHESFFGSHSTR